MADAGRDLVAAWIAKMQADLDTARQLAGLPDGHLDIAIYHCQQAAEKAVKAFLAFQGHSIERTHDVEYLVKRATAYEAGFTVWNGPAAMLTPFAVSYRYPEEAFPLEPSREEFETALVAASGLVDFVLSLLPYGKEQS